MIRQIPQLRIIWPKLLIVVLLRYCGLAEEKLGFMLYFNDGVVDCVICPKYLLTLSVGTFHVGEL